MGGSYKRIRLNPMEKGVGTYTFDSATKYDTLLCTMIYYHFGKFVRYLDNPPGVDKCRVRSLGCGESEWNCIVQSWIKALCMNSCNKNIVISMIY